MIQKIAWLKSVGKFRNYTASGAVSFLKLTLVFGDNGSGKTTLTSMFRSLANNDPEILKRRLSTDHSLAQTAQVILRDAAGVDTHHTFNASGWSKPLDNVEVFDIHFVNTNVYSGFDFGDDNKKQLHRFILGAQGIGTRERMAKNKADKQLLRTDLDQLEKRLIADVLNGVTAELITPFLEINAPEQVNLDAQIEAAEKVLASSNAEPVIRTLEPLEALDMLDATLALDAIQKDFGVTTQALQVEALSTLYKDHCDALHSAGMPRVEPWLNEGYNYLRTHGLDETSEVECPFCKQRVTGSMDIIQSYANRFDDAYVALVARLDEYEQSFKKFNLDAQFQGINTVYKENEKRIQAWDKYLSKTLVKPSITGAVSKAEMNSQKEAVAQQITEKQKKPATAIAADSTVTLAASLKSTNEIIKRYNDELATYNAAIQNFRQSLVPITMAQAEVNRLRRVQKRAEQAIVAQCDAILKKRRDLKKLEDDYATLSKQQETDSQAFFVSYGNRVNHYLKDEFRTPFRLEEVRHVPPRGKGTESKVSYKLTIDGHDISFDGKDPVNAGDCLSEGDKSTLALAFFLAKLDIDAARASKILVFDDPLSSLDSKRRTYTVGILKKLMAEMVQVVVLSHNEFFLDEVARDIAPSDKRILRVTENFVAKESVLELCDLDELVKHDYFKQVEELERFRLIPDLSKKEVVLGWMRNVLESHLRFKFYRQLLTLGGQKTFGKLIGHLDTSGVVFRDNADRASIIAKLHLINSVSWRPHHGGDTPTVGNGNPHSIAAAELDGLIQDVLDLIDNKL